MKIADHLLVTEFREGAPQHKILLADLATVTIGRSPKCNIQISDVDGMSRVQATVYATANEARGHRDYYIRDGGLRNGQWVPSQAGVWSGGTQLHSNKGFRLGPGAELELFPSKAGYRCILEWPAERDSTDESNPTVGFQNRINKEQILARDAQIKGLQTLAGQLNSQYREMAETLATERKNFDAYLEKQSQLRTEQAEGVQAVNEALAVEQSTNVAQNKKIGDQAKKLDQLRRIQLVVTGLVLGALVLSMGVETEELKALLEIVAGVSAAGGLAYSVSQS